jgi:predicted PurR-regulated permease PerM
MGDRRDGAGVARTVKRMETPNRPPAWIWRWTAGAIALWWVGQTVISAISALHDIVLIAVVSFLVACALEQPVTWLERRGWKRGAATGLVLAASVLSTVTVAIVGGAVVFAQATSLREAAPGLIATAGEWLQRAGIEFNSTRVSADLMAELQQLLQANAGTFILQSGVLIGQFSAGGLLVFYLVADGPRLRRNVCSILPAQRQQQVLDVWTSAIEKAGGYFIVRAVLAVCAFFASWVFFAAASVPYAVALAIWVGVVSQAIPAVGTYLAGALPVLVAAGVSGGRVLAVLAFMVVYQQVENYLLSPRVSRRVMQVHPAIAFFGAVCGAVIAGAAGALIAVPIIATVQAVLAASVERHQLVVNQLLESAPKRKPRRRRNAVQRAKAAAKARRAGETRTAGAKTAGSKPAGSKPAAAKSRAAKPAGGSTANGTKATKRPGPKPRKP